MRFLKRLLVDRWGRREDGFHWRKSQRPLDPATVESVLLLHVNGKLGDAMIDVLLVDALARRHPEIPVFVGTTAPFERYWRSHPHVRDVAIFPRGQGRSALARVPAVLRATRPWRGRFGLAVSFESFAQPDHFALLRALAPKSVVGFNKNGYRLFDYSLDEGRHGVIVRHVSSKVAAVMRVLGDEVDVRDLRFHVPFGPEDERGVQPILDHLPLPGPRLFFHTYGTAADRVLSPSVVARSVAAFRRAGHGGPVWISVPKDGAAAYADALRDDRAVLVEPTGDFYGLFALLAKMDLVVAVDTSVGHIAAALGKPQVALFSGEANTPIVWRPLNDRCVSVVAPDDQPVDAIDLDEVEAAVRAVLA